MAESLALERYLAQIGLIAVQWSHLEVVFSNAIWYLLRLDVETGKIVTGGLDMVPRANMAINLARHLKAPKVLIDGLVLARKKIQDGLDQRRNQIIHGVQRSGRDHSTALIDVHRGKGSRQTSEVSLDDLIKLSAGLKAVREPLDAIIYKLVIDRRDSWTAT